MNGILSPSVNFGLQSTQISSNPGFSFLSNPMGLSFFGNSNHPSTNGIFQKYDGSNFNATTSAASAAEQPRASSFSPTDLDRLWGIGDDNPIIDDDQSRENAFDAGAPDHSDGTVDSVNDVSDELVDSIPVETGIAEGAEVAEASTPWGLIALANQQLGQGLNEALTASLQNTASQNYSTNINQHGVNVGLNASIIQSNQDATIRAQQAGGAIGSIFGPLGTLIGHAVAGTVSANPNLLNTAASSTGWINPTDTTTANSATTVDQSGSSTMTDAIDNATS